MAIWFNLEPGEREAEGFGTTIATIESFVEGGRRAFGVDG